MANPVHTWTVEINATPDKIWPYVADLDKHDEWSPKPYKVEWTSGTPNTVGSTFKSVGDLPQDKGHAMEGTVVTNEAPTKFAVQSHDKDGEFVNTLELAPEGGQTKVTRTVEFPAMKGAYKVIFPVILPIVVRPAVQKGMNMLKTQVEGS